MKNTKGITLVALVVTIIILLILAGITILKLTGSGLFENAKLSEEKYKNAQEIENGVLANYESLIESINGSRDIDAEQLTKLIDEIVDKKLNAKTTIPTGNIISQMGKEAPVGYLICDGTEYNIADYKILADYINEQFGSYNYFGGDGTTTFAVPNLTGKFLKGNNSDNIGVYQQAGLPNISGFVGLSLWGYQGNGAFYSVNEGTGSSAKGTSGATELKTYMNASRSSSIYGKSTTVTPENLSVLYCIKY